MANFTIPEDLVNALAHIDSIEEQKYSKEDVLSLVVHTYDLGRAVHSLLTRLEQLNEEGYYEADKC